MIRLLAAIEDRVAASALAAMVALPLVEIVVRRLFGVGVPGSGPFVQHLTLWVGFLGAAIAAREGKLLALATGAAVPERARRPAAVFAAAVAACMATILAYGAVQLVVTERETGTIIAANVPAWVGQLALPVGFALIALRLAWRADTSWWGRAIGAAGIVAGLMLVRLPGVLEHRPAWPGLLAVMVAGVVGAPIFAILGGAAVLLFMSDGVTPATVLIETYSLSVSPTLPAIPLFTLAGFILAEGHASARLLRVFRAWFGWIPGGTAVVCAVLCTFFTAFTGGSGVTILAVGGVLFPALLKEGYRDQFSLGLLTVSGSLGLLLPPSLPLILYAVVAQIPIEDLFIGGLLPGILLTAMIAAWGVREGVIAGTARQRFARRRGRRVALGCEVGARDAGRRRRVDVQRDCHGGRGGGADGLLRVSHSGGDPPRPERDARPPARVRGMRRGHRRRAGDSRRRRRPHQLPGRGPAAGARWWSGCARTSSRGSRSSWSSTCSCSSWAGSWRSSPPSSWSCR